MQGLFSIKEVSPCTDLWIMQWVEYIEELYNGNGTENDLVQNEDQVDEDEKGDLI